VAKRQAQIFGHPVGLYVLFFTEMWERFSYYGMRALLVLYMVNYFKWTQESASGIYKWYTSLVYLTPLLGGYLADRYLGNKRAIIIGAILMAIAHFLMAFEATSIFYSALVFLIVGNGFFKPNMSTQVGRLYSANDNRRDSAYTIFYMGINLGAFMSPLICDWLRVNTRWEYHAGFTAAGVGMVLGLLVYLFGLRWVEEIPEGVTDEEENSEEPEGDKHKANTVHYMTEAEAATTPSIFPTVAAAAPTILAILAVVSVVVAPLLWIFGFIAGDDAIAFALGGGFACAMGAWIASQLAMAVRDRVLAIYVVAIFVVFFWSAFEQAGNAMNVYADKTTNRYLTEAAPTPEYPATDTAEVQVGDGFMKTFNPVPTGWFQSINALAIFVMAPFFAWMWVYLPTHGINLSIPAKVTIGVAMQAVAFLLMFWSISYENGATSAPLAKLPPGITTEQKGQVMFRDAPDLENDAAFENYTEDISGTDPNELGVVNGGRLYYAESDDELNNNGVLADTDRDRILRATVSKSFLLKVRELAKKSEEAKTAGGDIDVSVALTPPPGFDMRYSGLNPEDVHYDKDTGTLIAKTELLDKDYKGILAAGADPAFRKAIGKIFVESAKFKVSSLWLFWFYILCTIGELCLSPVGLSMVSKLAPAKFATMLMGVWLLTRFFGNFFAGLAGEYYGTINPSGYFFWIAVIVGAASLICLITVKPTKKLMHGVN